MGYLEIAPSSDDDEGSGSSSTRAVEYLQLFSLKNRDTCTIKTPSQTWIVEAVLEKRKKEGL
jgi:hypothetical protein